MSKDPKKTAQAAGPVVYCGPTIPGVAVQFTTYTNGVPTALEEATKETRSWAAWWSPWSSCRRSGTSSTPGPGAITPCTARPRGTAKGGRTKWRIFTAYTTARSTPA